MKKVLGLVLLTMVAFLFSTAAMAFDDLYTQDTSAVVKTGSIDVGGKLLYEFGKKFYDKDGESVDAADSGSLIRVPLIARYGIMDKLDAFAILPIVSHSKLAAKDKSGIGDIWLGAKYAVMEEGMLTVRGALDLPTGSDKDMLGNAGGFGIDVAAMTAKMVDKFNLDGQIGVRWNAEGPKDAGKEAPGVGIYVTAQGMYPIIEKLDGILGIEYGMAGDSKFDGTKITDSGHNLFTLNVGAKYMVMEKCGLRADIMVPLAGKNEFGGIGIILGVMYNVK
jgi:hypothetical protein